MERANVLNGPAAASRSPARRDPLPLRNECTRTSRLDVVCDRLLPVLWVASTCGVLAIHEWLADSGHWSRHPWGYTVLAVVAGSVLGFQYWRTSARRARRQR